VGAHTQIKARYWVRINLIKLWGLFKHLATKMWC